jgi:hypothetical protein
MLASGNGQAAAEAQPSAQFMQDAEPAIGRLPSRERILPTGDAE